MRGPPKLLIRQMNTKTDDLEEDPIKKILDQFSLTKSFKILGRNGLGYNIETKDKKCLVCDNECNSCIVRHYNNMIYALCTKTNTEQCVGSSPIDYDIMNSINYEDIKVKIINDIKLYSFSYDWGQTKLVQDALGEVLKRKGGKMYIYNGSSKLWSESDHDNYSAYVIATYLDNILTPIIMEQMNIFRIMEDSPSSYDEVTVDKQKKLIHNLSTMREETKKTSFMTKIVKTLTSALLPNMDDEAGSPYFFPIRDGEVVNLRTGDVSERIKSHNFCFESKYTYLGRNYKCLNMERFMRSIFKRDDEVEYMQALCGYCLSGDISDRAYYVFSGTTNGRNGKSVLLELFKIILGGFQRNLMPSALLKGKSSSATPEIVPLLGARLATISELGKGDQLNVPLIKRLTCKEDTVTVRPLYGKPIEFSNKAKLIMATNHDPNMELDGAIKDRTRLIPFNVQFIEKEKYEKLEDKSNYDIKDEKFINHLKSNCGDEILTYFVNGAIKYFTKPPDFPKTFKDATDEYIDGEDNIKTFLIEKCIISPEKFCLSKEFLDAYNDWAIQGKITTMNSRSLKKELTSRGFTYKVKRISNNTKMCIIGIELLTDLAQI